jgi:lipopolysaccharide transport system permease protein
VSTSFANDPALSAVAPGAEAAASPMVQTVIAPPTRWPTINFPEFWKYRELLFFFVWRDIKVRYKQTFLGVAWAVLQPAMMMVVFTVMFNRIAGISTDPYDPLVFYLSGLLPWYFFQQSVNASGMSVVGSEHLVTKIYFPRLIIPIASVFAAVFDSLIALVLLTIMAAISGVTPTVNLLALPLVYIIIALLAAGIGTFIAALNVVYRDFRYIVPYALQLGLFATPTIYMPHKEHAGQTIRLLLHYNPLTTLVSAYRASTLGGEMPWDRLLGSAAVAVLVFAAGCLYFRKTEDRFADII